MDGQMEIDAHTDTKVMTIPSRPNFGQWVKKQIINYLDHVHCDERLCMFSAY